jgi:hypothetical protein
MGDGKVEIREYDPSDRAGTEAVDGECELGQPGGMSLHADLLGDPLARIRHSPAFLMLVGVYCGPVFLCTAASIGGEMQRPCRSLLTVTRREEQAAS